MSTSVKQLLDNFDRLPDTDKREVAAEIVRRTVKLDLPPLTNEELTLNAEYLFQALDQEESGDEHPQAG